MQRIKTSPRPNWHARVEEVGLVYHTADGQPYWDESAYYKFSAQEIDTLEKAGNDVYELCLEAAQHIIDKDWFERLALPIEAAPLIIESWNRDDFSLYGRFDFAWSGFGPPKLLEFNADTPTALVEAAVAQWYWLQDVHAGADQFNSIHEKLIRGWSKLDRKEMPVRFASVKDHPEDEQTVLYLQDTAHQAGLQTLQAHIEDIGFHPMRRRFVDANDESIERLFKLFPWEWIVASEFAPHLKLNVCEFIEPMWKMLLSNKAILPILWELFPKHPNLLSAYFDEESLRKNTYATKYVRKPLLSREGANVTLIEHGQTKVETAGEYGEEGYVYQTAAELGSHDGNVPVFGVWIVDHEACGLGIREDRSPITGNLSRFIPHLF
ncbi:MAG TPA: glutathionylspermidine synthase family protein [Verrucomicrobiae bacterium]|nr:glutathionylspermidine synthase family protein [Verrucomicrobiae bacterium]